MVCMEHFQHFVKKDFSKIGVSYASCGPSSHQGGIEISERGDVVPLSEVNLVHSCHTRFLFYYSNNNNGFTTKEENNTVIYSIYNDYWEPSSQRTKSSPMNMNI